MADPFDVFELFGRDLVRWIGAATNLAEARAAIEKSERSATDTYLILDRSTGQKVTFKMTKEGLVRSGLQPGAGQGRAAVA
ncbi:MAG TPA: hypothetical protein VIH97_08030 [Candidatus Acidoferrales bacterium]